MLNIIYLKFNIIYKFYKYKLLFNISIIIYLNFINIIIFKLLLMIYCFINFFLKKIKNI